MSKFTFICEDEPMPFADAIVTKKTFEFNADHLDSIIGEFETFLRGCGFYLDGNLELVGEPLGKKYSKYPDDLSKDGELDLEARESLDMYTESLFNKK
jgi:hypothetical protein